MTVVEGLRGWWRECEGGGGSARVVEGVRGWRRECDGDDRVDDHEEKIHFFKINT